MPKIVENGKLVDLDPVELSDACVRDLNDDNVIKVLATTDKDGSAHSAPRGFMRVLDEEYPGCVAYMEMVEGSQTGTNMLWSFERNRPVSITTVNPKTGATFQVKGLPHRYTYDGKLWLEFLEMAWASLPRSEPAGVWVIVPIEERDESFETRMAAEEDRMLPESSKWRRYTDARTVKRYKEVL